MTSVIEYDREKLVSVLTYHQRATSSHCGCGWSKLGHSHPEHVADIYEETATIDRGFSRG